MPSPAWGMAASNSSRARLGVVESAQADERVRLHRSPVEDARAASDAEESGRRAPARWPRGPRSRSPRAEASETPAMAAVATGSTRGNRSAAVPRRARRAPGRKTTGRERRETWAARACARARSSGAVGVLCQCGRQLGMGDRRVPVAPAEMGVTQMRHARTRIGGGQAGAQPGRRHTEVGDGPGQIIDVDLQHAPHDQGVGL